MGDVKERRDGPAGESPASSPGEGRELHGRRGGGRGILRECAEGGMAGSFLSTSPSALSVRSGLAREKAGRKAAEAGVAYWRLLGKKTRKSGVRWVFGSLKRGYLPNGQRNWYP